MKIQIEYRADEYEIFMLVLSTDTHSEAKKRDILK